MRNASNLLIGISAEVPLPYSNEIRVAAVSGTPPSLDVFLLLWELSTTFDNANRMFHKQVDQDSTTVPVAGSIKTGFSLVRGPDFLANNNHSISLAAYQSGHPGPMFRTGRLDTLPPGAPANPGALVDVILVEQQRYTMTDLNAMITTPITLGDGTVVDTVTISSAPPSGALTLVAIGFWDAYNYTYRLSFTIEPSNDQFDPTIVLGVSTGDKGSVALSTNLGPGRASVGDPYAPLFLGAFIDNLFEGLFEGQIMERVIPEMTSRLNSAAAAGGAAAAGVAGGAQALPAGVQLGVWSVGVASNGDLVISPAIGSLGSIIDRFSAAAPQGGSGCFIASAAFGADSAEVATLRAFRDELLISTRVGRIAVAVYERGSPPLAALVARRPRLRAMARRVLICPTALIAKRFLKQRSNERAPRRP